MNSKLLSVAVLCGMCFSATAFAGPTLDKIRARGELVCGVNTSAPGFAAANSQGKWEGLDVNLCRGVQLRFWVMRTK